MIPNGVPHSQSPDQRGILRIIGVRWFRIRRGHHEAGRVRERRRRHRRSGGDILAAQRLQKGIIEKFLCSVRMVIFHYLTEGNHDWEVYHFSLDMYFWTTPFGTGLGYSFFSAKQPFNALDIFLDIPPMTSGVS